MPGGLMGGEQREQWRLLGPHGEAMWVDKDGRAARLVGPQFSRVLELFLRYAEIFSGVPVRRHWRTEGVPPHGPLLGGWGEREPSAHEASGTFLQAFLVPRGHQPPALGSKEVSCLYILHRPDGLFYVGEVQCEHCTVQCTLALQ